MGIEEEGRGEPELSEREKDMIQVDRKELLDALEQVQQRLDSIEKRLRKS